MKIKTSELTGAALDWAVAKCEGQFERSPHTGNGENFLRLRRGNHRKTGVLFSSTDWSQGGPIIERERIPTEWSPLWGGWAARDLRNAALSFTGPTLLIAAMRCYVASKLGDEVEVPEELCSA